MSGSAVRERRTLDRGLTALAAAYIGYVALVVVGGRLGVVVPGPADVGSSVDAIADGRLLRLFSSGLVVAGDAGLLQVAALALLMALVIVREGALVWWLAALVGHVGSALLAYGVIGLAAALGSGSAERTTEQLDYGISCVLAATVGALLVSSARRGERLLALGCLLSLALWIPFSIGWYAIEHLLAFLLGAAVVALADRRTSPARRTAPAG